MAGRATAQRGRTSVLPRGRATALVLVSIVAQLGFVSDALAQAGRGSSGFGGGAGGGVSRGGGGPYLGGDGGSAGSDYGGGAGPSGSGDSGSGGAFEAGFDALEAIMIAIIVFGVLSFAVRLLRERRRRRDRAVRDACVSTASAEAAEDDPIFAATAVKAAAAALYRDVQRAWNERDDAALARMLGPELLDEWRRRLADFARKGWTNEVAIRRGPEVGYVGLVNRASTTEDRVTVAVTAALHSIVKTRDGMILHRDEDDEGDGEIEVCEYWTLTREGDGWRLHSIEQEHEGSHHLRAPVVAAPWSDDARLSDDSLVELADADAPQAGVGVTELVSVHFDGSAREQALDLSLADPRCAPDVLEATARRAVEAWAEAVDGDDAALLEIATPQAARALLYPGGADGNVRVVVRGPRLESLAITALHAESEPLRIDVEARVRGRRYHEDRDTAAVLSGDRDRETRFTERWTLALNGPAPATWRIVSTA